MFLIPLVASVAMTQVASGHAAVADSRSERLDALLDGFVAKFHGAKRISDRQVDAWREVFWRGKPKDDRGFGFGHFAVGSYHWVNATVDYVSRSRLYDSTWREISLPRDLRWNEPWRPQPTNLRDGYVFLDEDSTYAEGGTVPARLEWLKVSGRSAKLVKRFEANYCLEDDVPVAIFHGDTVRFREKEDPKTFWVTGADAGFTRYLTWKCTPNGIRLVASDPKTPEIRFIDREIARAQNAKHPNALQRRIVKLWPTYIDLADWSEKRSADGILRVSFDNQVGFVVGGKPGGYRLLGVGKDRSFEPQVHE